MQLKPECDRCMPGEHGGQVLCQRAVDLGRDRIASGPPGGRRDCSSYDRSGLIDASRTSGTLARHGADPPDHQVPPPDAPCSASADPPIPALVKTTGSSDHSIRTLLGRRLIDRWEMWQPAIDAIGGSAAYPMFERLVSKMRAAV